MFNTQVFAYRALKGGWYVLGPILGFWTFLLMLANEATNLVIVIAFLVMLSVSLIVWIIQYKQIDNARKATSYQAWNSLHGHELTEQVRKIVKDYKDDGKYYDAQLKRFFRMVKYMIALAGAAGFSAEAIENTISSLATDVEDKLEFRKFIDLNGHMTREHVLTVVVVDGGEFGINLIGRHYDPEY